MPAEMPTSNGRKPRSPLKQWLVDARGTMKHPQLVGELTRLGYRTRDDEPVKEVTIRGWEAPSSGDPPAAVIPYLEKIFKLRAPTSEPVDITDLVSVIRDQTLAINRLVTSLRPPQTRDERVAAIAAQIEALSVELAFLQQDEAAEPHTPPAPRRRRQG